MNTCKPDKRSAIRQYSRELCGQQIRDGAHTQTSCARRPLLNRRFAIGCRAIDVQPALLVIFHEMGQEARRGACTRWVGRTAGIVQLGKI